MWSVLEHLTGTNTVEIHFVKAMFHPAAEIKLLNIQQQQWSCWEVPFSTRENPSSSNVYTLYIRWFQLMCSVTLWGFSAKMGFILTALKTNYFIITAVLAALFLKMKNTKLWVEASSNRLPSSKCSLCLSLPLHLSLTHTHSPAVRNIKHILHISQQR